MRRRRLQGRGAGPGGYRAGEPAEAAVLQAGRPLRGQGARALDARDRPHRLLEEGEVRADDENSLLERTAPEASVAEANRVMHLDKHDVVGIERVLAVPELSANWRRTFEKRLSGHTEDTAPRLEGLADRRRHRDGGGEQ